jgi:uncharacterized protein (UPF0248 family)
MAWASWWCVQLARVLPLCAAFSPAFSPAGSLQRASGNRLLRGPPVSTGDSLSCKRWHTSGPAGPLVCLADKPGKQKKVKTAPKRVKSARVGGATGGLRPCRDVIERILWDPALDAKDFVFGYRDRFNGVREAEVSTPNENVKGQQRLLIKALPEHRIEYVKFRERIVWHKTSRVDLIFGTGSGGGAAGAGGKPVKIGRNSEKSG